MCRKPQKENGHMMEGSKMKLLKDAKADQLAALLKGQPEINLSALLKSPLPIQDTSKMDFPLTTSMLDPDTVRALAEHLHALLRNGDINTSRSFLNCFIKPERKRIVAEKVNGKTAIFTAVSCRMPGIMSYLIEECGANVDQHSEGSDDTTNKVCTGSALAYAASTNNMEAAHILVDYGANVNGATSTGLTPALCACFKGDRDMISYLAESGADINKPDQNGFTCLMHAYMHGDVEMASFLLSRGSNINAQCHKGLTPMHYASQNNKVDLARMLIKHGADLNIRSSTGNSPLHIAIEKGHLEMARFLVEAGSDPYIRNMHKEDCFLLAASSGAPKILKYLLEKHKSLRMK